MPEYRAHFDFDIRFANGGELSGTGFRLDLPAEDMSADEIGLLLVGHLGLALVDEVELRGLRIVAEPHRGSRGTRDAVAGAAPTRIVDLSHPIRAGLVTYPGLPAPTIAPHLTREDSRARYAPGTEFAMDVITMIGNTGTYLDSPFHRYAEGPDLAGLALETLVGIRAEVFHLEDSLVGGAPRDPRRDAGRPRCARCGRPPAHRMGPVVRAAGVRQGRSVPHG